MDDLKLALSPKHSALLELAEEVTGRKAESIAAQVLEDWLMANAAHPTFNLAKRN